VYKVKAKCKGQKCQTFEYRPNVYLDIPWNRVDARRSKIWLTIEAKMMAMELSMTLVWR